ncbi:outer membrane beta-barrel protein [Parapedobacter deserti]|uniref:Outer membrane beta-barrel protein n=1 Tax=Parapedobacter deserti TaxID=1912957 RepID=A0ABV7JLW5_9SPHI
MDKNFLISCILCIGFITTGLSKAQRPPHNDISGKVLNHRDRTPIAAATVRIRSGDGNAVVASTITDDSGLFTLSGAQPGREQLLEVSALGYIPYRSLVDSIGASSEILLVPDNVELEEVTVIGQRPDMQMGVDRRIYNIAGNLNAVGASAIDILKDIPSISIGVTGNIQLRNRAPIIFVDGKPTLLTMQQIPSDRIDRIEVITNPSARYDAASGAGIINIVLKKNYERYWSGIATASAGFPGIGGATFNVNRQQGPFGFTLAAGHNRSGGIADSRTYHENIRDGRVVNHYGQYTENDRRNRDSDINFGVDYAIDSNHTLSISQLFGSGRGIEDEQQQQSFFFPPDDAGHQGTRLGDRDNRSLRSSTRLDYRFANAGKELTAFAQYNTSTSDARNRFRSDFIIDGDGVDHTPADLREANETGSNQWTFQADYVNRLDENRTWEVGVRSLLGENTSRFTFTNVVDGVGTVLPISNHYRIEEQISAAYGLFSQKIRRFSYQAGLRLEYSRYTGTLLDRGERFGYQYPSGSGDWQNMLFPSLSTTYEINKANQLQASYTRRLRRAVWHEISPFVQIRDSYSLNQGNPLLEPEFIHSFELNHHKTMRASQLITTVYWRHIPQSIMQYADTLSAEIYEQMGSASVSREAIVDYYINAGTANVLGAELAVNLKPTPTIGIMPSINAQYNTIPIIGVGEQLNTSGVNWQAQLSASYSTGDRNGLLGNISLQLNANYESKRAIAQGYVLPVYNIDFVIRKSFMRENRASVALAVNDLFNHRRWTAIYDTPTYYQDAYQRWAIRTARLTFSYRFGNLSDFP